MTGHTAPPAHRPSSDAQGVVRRLIVFALLYAVVVIGASGLGGLIGRILDRGDVLADDSTGLARSLAFALIAIPLAAVLWWWQRRRLTEPDERGSLVWSLYLAAMTLTALINATVSMAGFLNASLAGDWEPGRLASCAVWAGVWLWHRSMREDPAISPTRLPHLSVQLSAAYGLIVAAIGSVTAIAALVSEALTGFVPVIGDTRSAWFVPVLQALVWAAIGAVVWWWHWLRERASTAPGDFGAVLLVIIHGAAAATTLFATGTVLHVVLRLLLDSDPTAEILRPLGTAVGAALVGAIIWVFHDRDLPLRSSRVREAGRLVVSGIALIGAASGFGVVINALLASLGPQLIESDHRTLLLGGVSALLVGGPVWWLAWRPTRQTTPEEAGETARRVYLVALFGASAVVALVTLLLVGYRIFDVLLDDGGGSLIHRVRAPFGLLCATGLVFGYHFAVWRADRQIAIVPPRSHQIGRVVLVVGAEPGELAAQVRAETDIPVTLWQAADERDGLTEAHLPAALAALEGVSAPRVLVVAGEGDGVRVVPLAD